MAASSSSAVAPLRIGGPAPGFSVDALVGEDFKKVSLGDFAGKYLVLFFYPLDFTFVCPSEILAFEDNLAKFNAIGCAVVGASVDSLYSHLAWTQSPRKAGGLGAPLSFPLIADLTKDVSNAYGAMLGDTGHTCRALYVIDGKGDLRHASFNDAPVGRNIDEVLRIVQAFQHVDTHGQVCPINWTPGARTMHADPVKSREYFEAVNQ